MNEPNENISIIINLDANEGQARHRWENNKEEILRKIGGKQDIKAYSLPYDLNDYLSFALLEKRIRSFIIGGGDGTINYVVNEICKIIGLTEMQNIAIGALALGSSNDFTKPVKYSIEKIPLKIDFEKKVKSDIGFVRIHKLSGEIERKAFFVNSGIGVIANANHYYNNPGKLVNFLKRKWTPVSILVTAIITILKNKNISVEVTIEDKIKQYFISNLSITLIPYISGSFHYKKVRPKKAGFFDIFICHDMNKFNLLTTLSNLASGKFLEGEKTKILKADKLLITSKEEIPLEMDGEITMGNRFEFTLIKEGIILLDE